MKKCEHGLTTRECFTCASPKYAAHGDSTEQALGLYAAQAEAIRELLDKHAPNTTGNLQTRLAQVFAAGVPGRLPPTDSFPDQSVLHDEANVGNCLQATIAGVLGWPLDRVPHFALLGEEHWWDAAQSWLDWQGYWIDYKPDTCTRDGGELLPRCWQSGPTVRGTQHAVIGDSATGRMLHDPHPSRAGLTEVEFTVYFYRKPRNAGVVEVKRG